ncbi:YslB family protein [Carnobacterium funditum]|uniref:YslB family protein n=1 Tax=Carnobacterium funditum TaxID=2752 RepID=UPI00068BBADE|nr:YslB family protein [Carnobacterium funditum]
MNEQKTTIDLNLFEENSPFFGQTLLRDVLIPNLLRNETNEILYWAGKEIARQYPLCSIQDIILFFEKAGFGTLMLDKRDHHAIVYRLTGSFVESRIKAVKTLSFNLEAGFLAEQIQQQESNYTEAFYELDTKNLSVLLILKQDAKDSEPIEQNNAFFTLNKKNKEPDSLDFPGKIAKEKLNVLADTLPTIDKSEDIQLENKTAVFDELPSRSSKHNKK